MLAYLGTTIGILGWLIGFSIVCLAAGSTETLLKVLPPGLTISLIAAGIIIVVMESVIHRFGYGHYMLQLTLWALLLSFMGLLMFVLNHWLAPLIEADSGLTAMLARTGSVYRVGDTVPTLLMTAGVCLLAVVVVLLLKEPPGGPNE